MVCWRKCTTMSASSPNWKAKLPIVKVPLGCTFTAKLCTSSRCRTDSVNSPSYKTKNIPLHNKAVHSVPYVARVPLKKKQFIGQSIKQSIKLSVRVVQSIQLQSKSKLEMDRKIPKLIKKSKMNSNKMNQLTDLIQTFKKSIDRFNPVDEPNQLKTDDSRKMFRSCC